MPEQPHNPPDQRQNVRPALETLSDEELMRRVRDQDDANAFNALVDRFSGELQRYLRHYLHNTDAADDVLQTVFLQAYRHRDQYRSERRLRPWLYGIATHSAVDWLRTKTRLHEQSFDQPPAAADESSEAFERRLLDLVAADLRGPASQAESGEQRALLRKAIRKLPDHLRSVVVLVCLLGMKQRDAAETLDVPVGTIKSRTHEAIRTLRKEFASPGESAS
ncbi:MAG: RNA polymerase sigma factor [Planctomycetaceae bacterium]